MPTSRTQHVSSGADIQKNFLVVDAKTDTAAIENAFQRFTEERKDIGIVLVNQHVSGCYSARVSRECPRSSAKNFH